MKLRYEFELMELDDQLVAVPIGEESHEYQEVIMLNESAGRIFGLLQDGVDEDAIVDIMLKEYNTSKDNLVLAVHKCINEFRKKGLLIE